MVLVVGGNFDVSQMRYEIQSTFGQQQPRLGHIQTQYHVSESIIPRFQSFQATSNMTLFSIRFPTVGLLHHDLYALDLLDYVLGDGRQSVLHALLVEKKKLAYSVRTYSATPKQDTGYFEVVVECDANQLEAVRSEIKAVLESTKLGQVSRAQMDRARRKKLAEDILETSSMSERVKRESLSVFYTGSPGFFERYARSFKQVKRRDLSNVARHYFDWNKRVETVMYPVSELGQDVLPQPITLDPEAPTIHQLSNGMSVIFEQNSALPKAQITVVMKGGLLADTPTQNGQTKLLTRLLGKGSARHNRARYLSIFEDRGAQIGARMGNQVVEYSLQSVSEDFPQLLDRFLEGLLTPLITEENLALEKRQQEADIMTRGDSWWSQASYLFRRHFFPHNSPFSLSQDGELDVLNDIQPAQLTQLHARLMNPDNMVVSVVGDFDEDEVLATLESSLSSLRPSASGLSEVPKIQHSIAHEFSLSLRQDVGAVLVAFDGIGFDRLQDDVGLSILDAVLSGARYPGGRLHKRLRGRGWSMWSMRSICSWMAMATF